MGLRATERESKFDHCSLSTLSMVYLFIQRVYDFFFLFCFNYLFLCSFLFNFYFYFVIFPTLFTQNGFHSVAKLHRIMIMSISYRRLQHQSPIPSIWFLRCHFAIQQHKLVWCRLICKQKKVKMFIIRFGLKDILMFCFDV